jgi:hypothetical protein
MKEPQDDSLISMQMYIALESVPGSERTFTILNVNSEPTVAQFVKLIQ